MKGPEAKVKEACKKMLEVSGAYFFMPYQAGMGRAGVPDIVACYKGHMLGVECKAGKGKTTALQERELQKIRDAGGTALVIREDNMDELQEALDAH
jgi:Holliday junction resolvase